ncbi:MAG: hypothetical protein BWK75_02255 [Candidatus Altiarchaeales archaeon A3]|nr:MAG: hypothetical protein BWK75_02255 [Candidatus Altiarchaeales archaeon A3]
MEFIPPAILFLIGAIIVPFLRGKIQKAWILLIPLLAFIDMLIIYFGEYEGIFWTIEYAGFTLTFARIDSLSIIFGFVFVIMSFIGNLYALHVKGRGQPTFAFLYAGSAIGTVFCGDLITLFIFWEIMAWSSVFLIWYGGRKESGHAGLRYLLVHNVGGALLFIGIVMHYSATGSTDFGFLGAVAGGNLTLASIFILLGFIINAAVPPLHAWLTDAYPEASITGAVFLSVFTTKTAVYVLIRGFPGTEILIYLGAIMAVYGVVYAVLENDIRRLLSYHIISQVGYMVCAVGLGTAMALNGASAHAFAHILYKGLLFMGAGAVIYMAGKSKLTELGGLYKTMPLVFVLYMIGGFAISSVPFFSGFVSKSMIITGAGELGMLLIWSMLVLASAGTFLSVGIKLPYLAFFGKDSGIRVDEQKLPKNMLYAMGIAAFLCIFIGIYPLVLYDLLPYIVDFVPYTLSHVSTEIAFLMFALLAFFMFLKYGVGTQTISIDADWIYRKLGNLTLRFIRTTLHNIATNTSLLTLKFYQRVVKLSLAPYAYVISKFKCKNVEDVERELDKSAYKFITSSTTMALLFLLIGFLVIMLNL